ncbi:hypothetical protein NDU88_006437 [Pleurodeles waltl]|uniref:Secreted protein n=1 Tax=Pleurodeles waltl TaxID=8319 RepID=A0AAV7NQB0_PLEWA|nr:hypothetical protein NDU88_006437 [Pleurodeles waltl]
MRRVPGSTVGGGRGGRAVLMWFSLSPWAASVSGAPAGGPRPQGRGGARGARQVVEVARLPPPPVSKGGEVRSLARVGQLPEAAAQSSAAGLGAIFLIPCVHGGGERASSAIGASSTRPPVPVLGTRCY